MGLRNQQRPPLLCTELPQSFACGAGSFKRHSASIRPELSMQPLVLGQPCYPSTAPLMPCATQQGGRAAAGVAGPRNGIAPRLASRQRASALCGVKSVH